MRTMRVNITLEREPGVVTVRIRLGNKFVRATLRGVSQDDLVKIATDIPRGGRVLNRFLIEAARREECFAKGALKLPWVHWSPEGGDQKEAPNA